MGFLDWLRGTRESKGTPRRPTDLAAAAETAADLLVELTDRLHTSFFEALVGDNASAVTPQVTARGSAELLVFALHLSDRIALTRLGKQERATFMDTFLPAVQRRVRSALSPALLDLYNQRTLFYQSCRMPSGERNANLKGTLFWEFGKLMASPCHYPDPVYPNWNPIAMTRLSLWGMDLMIALTDAFDAAKLF
jgi:hypothetical protein